MTATPEPTRHQDVSEAARQVLDLGESGRYEFKRDVDVVSPKLLAALANWVALEPARESACLLDRVASRVCADGTTECTAGHQVVVPDGPELLSSLTPRNAAGAPRPRPQHASLTGPSSSIASGVARETVA